MKQSASLGWILPSGRRDDIAPFVIRVVLRFPAVKIKKSHNEQMESINFNGRLFIAILRNETTLKTANKLDDFPTAVSDCIIIFYQTLRVILFYF